MSTPQNTPLPTADGGAERKAFIFYSNWYTDARRGLDDTQLAEFVLVIIRYASEGIVPDETTTPVVSTMFGLIRPAIDADLKKYGEIVESNRVKAEASAENRRSLIKRITAEKHADVDVTSPDVEVVDNERSQCLEPIINNQESKINNQESIRKGEKEEEARGGIFVSRDEVAAYWREHGYKSDLDEFLDYYTRRRWITVRGIPIRSWKRAAVMWEDKYRHDVLPQRRREARAQAAAEAEARLSRQAAEAAAQRRSHSDTLVADADRAARRHVPAELGKHMYRRAIILANGDDNIAMDLMRRAPDDPAVFKRLAEGYKASPPALPEREGARMR